MAGWKTVLTLWRSLVLVGSVITFAFGIWSLIIIRDITSRGELVLESFRPRLGIEADTWSHFIAAAAQDTARTLIIVITSSAAALTILLVIMSNRYYWLRISSTIVMLIEVTTSISLAVVFGCALSLAIDLKAFNTPPFKTLDSADLSFFAILLLLSKVLAIVSGLMSIFSVTTSTASLINVHRRRKQNRDIRSFEPTISALGMSHSFHALHPPPRTTREPIPTTYDLYEAFHKGSRRSPATKDVTFANEGAWMSRKHSRWSASTASPPGMEGDVMKLLQMKRVRRAVPVRPARPLSEMWNNRDGAHAIL